jgi:16S rRNA (guanine527-N7)-methyltransferase
MSDGSAARLVQLAAGLGVAIDAGAAARITRFLDAMLAVNETLNLTAVRDPAVARIAHALDSLALGLWPGHPRTAIDLGTGNGFPGIAIRILHPRADLVWVERTRKKADALARLVLATEIGPVRVLAVDAAQLPALHPELRDRAELITARALAEPAEVGALAAPLAAPGATLALWLEAHAPAPAKLGAAFRRAQDLRYELPAPFERIRRLVLYERTGPR